MEFNGRTSFGWSVSRPLAPWLLTKGPVLEPFHVPLAPSKGPYLSLEGWEQLKNKHKHNKQLCLATV